MIDRGTHGERKKKKQKHRDRNFSLSFSWVSKFSLDSFHTSFPPPSPFGTYLICSVRPEPSMVLAPHRCSFSEMSFYRRQHSAISDGKRCAKLSGHTAITHAPHMPCISCFLQPGTLLGPLSMPIPPRPPWQHGAGELWNLPFYSASLKLSPLGLLQLLNPSKLYMSSSNPGSQAKWDPVNLLP